MNKLKVVILAGGQGSRMKSKIPKVLHKVLDKTMIDYILDACDKINVDDIMVIVGHQSAMVKSIVGQGVKYAYQKEQLGTGHAVMQTLDFIKDDENVLILYGDTPLIKTDTLKKLMDIHTKEKNYVTVISSFVNEPKGYGRIIRENGIFNKIVEQKDATENERKVNEINTGVYMFNSNVLKDALNKISNKNSKNEYYLTDTLELIKNTGNKIGIMVSEDSEQFLGVNSKYQLAEATRIMKERINKEHMDNGIILEDPSSIYIGKDVKIGNDTVILQGCIIEGESVIGSDCVIGPYARIVNSIIKDCVEIDQSKIISSNIDSYTKIGPYANIRPNTNLGEHIEIGSFVEIKNSTIDDNTKISKLSYIGDSTIGKNVNFGSGSCVANYNGIKKYKTKIEDDVFIGCNTSLIAPVNLGKNCITGAGSTITKDVPENALAISRVREQINKLEYNRKK